VESVRRTLGQKKASERRVCRVLGQNRGTQRHRPRKVDGDRELLGVMRKIVETFPRHGSERTHRVLTGPEAFGGWKVNFKRVHRIWKEEHMQVPKKQRKRRRLPGSSANGCVRHRALHRNHVWSYDFLTERTEDGRQLRILVVIDEFTRECLAIEVARSFTARDVIMTLQYLFAVRGAPEHLRSDNGPEFVAKEIQEWLARACVRTLYIQKASPWENGYVESFNGRGGVAWCVSGRGYAPPSDTPRGLFPNSLISTGTKTGEASAWIIPWSRAIDRERSLGHPSQRKALHGSKTALVDRGVKTPSRRH